MSTSGRRWLELSVRCPSAADRAPLLAEGLVALGGRAIEERAGWFVTYVDDPPDRDGFADETLAALESMTGLDGVQVRWAVQEHEDWTESWKRGLEVRRITERIVVRPSWLPEPELRDGDVVIQLDPGMAFGTAEHGTTRGCLRLLDGVVERGQRILDVGSGSGILAVAAAGLGAAEVVAVESDELACEALAENLVDNGVQERVRIVPGRAEADTLRGYHPMDGVLANIESGVLLPLAPGLVAALAVGGWLVISGILVEEWLDVRARFESEGVDFVAYDEDGEWCSGLFKRPA